MSDTANCTLCCGKPNLKNSCFTTHSKRERYRGKSDWARNKERIEGRKKSSKEKTRKEKLSFRTLLTVFG